MFRFLRRWFGWAALLAVPQYETFDPTRPPGFVPRGADWTHAGELRRPLCRLDTDAVLLSGCAPTETPPALGAARPAELDE